MQENTRKIRCKKTQENTRKKKTSKNQKGIKLVIKK
jgi:hypothetical protein